jgi:hypothetical protein
MRALIAIALSAFVVACANHPTISSQTAPKVDLSHYQTYGFMPKLSTDRHGYASITTQLMKDAAAEELAKRGLEPSDNPDLLVNLIETSKDKVEGRADPRFGVSYGTGRWGRGLWGLGVGLGGADIRSVREDTLTIDVVDREKNELVWTGSARYRPTAKDRNDAAPRINDAVARIFGRFPTATKVAEAR